MAETTHNNNDYILLYNRGKRMTISDYMERNYIYGVSPQELFDLNKDLIWQQYTELDKEIEKAGSGKWPESADDLSLNSWLPSPCVLRINPSKVTAELAIAQTNAQVNTEDFYAFAADKIQDIYQDEGYRVADSSKRSPDCSVMGWFKSLYYVSLDAQGKKTITMERHDFTEFADLSRHIISLATSVTSNGGSFTMRLPIISARSEGVSVITEILKGKNGEREYGDMAGQRGNASKNDVSYEYGERGEYYAKSSFDDIEANYFNWLISSNDILFISFEKLDMELVKDFYKDVEGNSYQSGDTDNFKVSTKLANGVYDMVGLVDEVKVVTNSQSSEAYVEITGRDLMKLLIEDGSFFFNPSTTSDPSRVFANEQSYGKQGDIREADVMNNTYNNPINRLRRVTGEIDIFANRINMDISYILKGVISQLANVEVVPGYVFETWGEDRTKYIELEPEKKENNG
jgi:hypothetical protein